MFFMGLGPHVAVQGPCSYWRTRPRPWRSPRRSRWTSVPGSPMKSSRDCSRSSRSLCMYTYIHTYIHTWVLEFFKYYFISRLSIAPPFTEFPRRTHRRKVRGRPLLSNTVMYGAPASPLKSLAFTNRFLREIS